MFQAQKSTCSSAFQASLPLQRRAHSPSRTIGLRTPVCAISRRDLDAHYLEQVSTWCTPVQKRPKAGSRKTPPPPKPPRLGKTAARYHASATCGPWGYERPPPSDEDWRGQAFEWRGWDVATGRARMDRDVDDEDVGGVEDLYAVLGLQRFASREEVRTAYRALAKTVHPDVLRGRGSDVGNEEFLRVRKAAEILADEESKLEYDKRLRSAERYPGKAAHVENAEWEDTEERRRSLGKSELEEFVMDGS